MKRVTIRIPQEMHEAIRELSYQSRQSMNKIVSSAIKKYLERSDKMDTGRGKKKDENFLSVNI